MSLKATLVVDNSVGGEVDQLRKQIPEERGSFSNILSFTKRTSNKKAETNKKDRRQHLGPSKRSHCEVGVLIY